MNYSDQNQQGLLGLVTALKAGMDPNIAYQIYGNIQGDQLRQQEARQTRMAGLSQILSGAAQGGATQEQASMLGQAAPGPFGPAAENMLGQLYPADSPMAQAPMTTGGVVPQSAAMQPERYAAQAQSPLYQGPDPAQMQAQLDLQQQQGDLAAQAATAPAVAQSFAQAAVAKLYERPDLAAVVPTGATPPTLPGQTPAQILQALMMSEEYNNLDPQMQAVVLQQTRAALQRVATRLQTQGGPVGPGGGPGGSNPESGGATSGISSVPGFDWSNFGTW